MSDLSYPPRIAELLRPDRLNPLGPGSPGEGDRRLLADLTEKTLFAPHAIQDSEMARACLAGLWLYYDFLDESHSLSQSIETTTGSYWHGLMHRREPDYSNAKYWFRHVGQHPVFEPLQKAAIELAAADPDPAAAFLRDQVEWDPFGFVDLCQAATAGRARVTPLCQRIQQREWQLLFDWCYRHAIGSGS
jgi:hypothetical protein